MNKIAPIALFGALSVLSLPAMADSTLATAASGATSTAAHLDFRVRVPKVLYLRVGSGSSPITLANVTTVNRLTFTVPANQVGNGTSIAATAGSGDLGSGAVTVRLFANGGNSATLNSTTTGRMSNGVDTIPWTEILVASAALPTATAGWTNGSIQHPTFNDTAPGGAGSPVTLTGGGKMVRVEGKWTFRYANTLMIPFGDYGITIARKGRVTYTASQP